MLKNENKSANIISGYIHDLKDYFKWFKLKYSLAYKFF